MNLLDQIHFRDLKMSDLEELLNQNIEKAELLKVKLSKKYIDGKYLARIYDDEKIYFQRYYHYKYDFIATAYMHYDFSLKLDDILVSRRRSSKGTKGQAENKDATWQDRRNNNQSDNPQ